MIWLSIKKNCTGTVIRYSRALISLSAAFANKVVGQQKYLTSSLHYYEAKVKNKFFMKIVFFFFEFQSLKFITLLLLGFVLHTFDISR